MILALTIKDFTFSHSIDVIILYIVFPQHRHYPILKGVILISKQKGGIMYGWTEKINRAN